MRIQAIYSLLVIALYSCSKEEGTSTLSQSIDVNIVNSTLKIKDTTEISIENTYNENMQYNWSATDGTIIGNGVKVKYVAPSSSGQVDVSVTITGINHDSYNVSTKIMVYKQYVIIKADDLYFDKKEIIHKPWKDFIDYINNKNIKVSLGLIGNSLECNSKEYYSYLKMLVANGRFELWNHGYNHVLGGRNNKGELFHEFFNTSNKEQKDHFLRTQRLAKYKLGITLHCFGAPGNGIDQNTLKAIEEIDELKVWFYGVQNYSRLNLNVASLAEFPVGNPSFEKFKSNYKYDASCIFIQIHPDVWDHDKLIEFDKIIDFLKEKGVTFVNPYEYYQLTTLKTNVNSR